MKKNLLSIILLFVSVAAYGQTIEGRVIGREKEGVEYATVQLLDSTCSNIKNGAWTDEDGEFRIPNVLSGTYCIRIKHLDYPDSTFHNIQVNSETKLVFDIHPYCQYDSLRNNKICPLCHKKDKVIPIVYGLLIGNMEEEGITFKAGGCEITYCDPHWYCKRDKTKF